MVLQLDPNDVCLWRQHPPIEAGAHALLIGISDYPYLSGGSAPDRDRAPDNGGLGQLEVSALSAARFFTWLDTAGEIAGAPLATCRLLLAPRPDERDAVHALVGDHYAGADYELLRAALVAWGDDIAAGGRTADPNVALFFFSGHGVEVSASPAILASDVLNQRSADGGANKALAVDPMSIAVKTYGIDRGLFFIDACRNSPKVAQLLNLVGDQPLRPAVRASRRPDALIRLQSTASGLRSYQVKTDTATLFTRAVLDGLEGPPPSYIPYDTTLIPWQLLFSALEGHVKRKVTELLAGHSPLALQPVEPYGNPYNGAMLVARKTGPEPDAGGPEVLITHAKDSDVTLLAAVEESAARILRTARSLTTSQIADSRGDRHYRPSAGDLGDIDLMHAIFQHETITYPWADSLQFLNARTNEEADPEAARVIGAHSQEIDNRLVAWIDLAVAPKRGGALWIGAGGKRDSTSAAVVIPQDLQYPIPIRLDVAFEESEEGWSLSTMSARLSDPAELVGNVASVWAILWQAQRVEALADLGSAGRTVGLLDLQGIVDQKSESPVAAALAVSYLLRSYALDYLHDWPRNLANLFEWLPDGPVLWAETLLRRHDAAEGLDIVVESASALVSDAQRLRSLISSDPYREALGYFQMLAKRGAPLLASTLTFAIRQAALWREVYKAGLLPGAEEYPLLQALEYVERAGKYAVSGGSFSRFISTEATLSPELVLGHKRPRARYATAAG